jgi:TfoX/Sxy family transcriptional regulator of competence genes
VKLLHRDLQLLLDLHVNAPLLVLKSRISRTILIVAYWRKQSDQLDSQRMQQHFAHYGLWQRHSRARPDRNNLTMGCGMLKQSVSRESKTAWWQMSFVF